MKNMKTHARELTGENIHKPMRTRKQPGPPFGGPGRFLLRVALRGLTGTLREKWLRCLFGVAYSNTMPYGGCLRKLTGNNKKKETRARELTGLVFVFFC